MRWKEKVLFASWVGLETMYLVAAAGGHDFREDGISTVTYKPAQRTYTMAAVPDITTGKHARDAARHNLHTAPTSGLAPGHLQANLLVLPSRYANDFRGLCSRNPVPCPLIAESASVGSYDAVKSWARGLQGHELIADGFDMRRDVPLYMVYRDSELVKSDCSDITAEWTEDHVGFLVGCSFSFEHELSVAGLPARHAVQHRNTPIYRTRLPLCPSGVFANSTYVVSMRPYKKRDLDAVRRITRRYTQTHGEPLAWGWESVKRLGIKDIDAPEWGDAPVTLDGRPFGEVQGDDSSEEIPVFWGCGVTPQEAVMKAGLEGVVMAHAPGYMLVLDATDEAIVRDQ